PGASVISVVNAAQGSRPGPARPDSPTRLSALGVETEPCSPRNSVRSAVTDCVGEPEAAKAIFFAKSPAHAFRANIAPLAGSHSQTTWSGAFSRRVPRAHSTWYVADKRRGRSPSFGDVRHTNLIGSSVATKTKRS